MTYSRSRIGQINQSPRNKRYLRYLEESIEAGKSNVLVLGNGCLLGLASSALGAASVQLHESHREDAFCIPARARCYAQEAQSPLAAQWNSLKTLANLDGEPLLQPPEQLKGCQ